VKRGVVRTRGKRKKKETQPVKSERGGGREKGATYLHMGHHYCGQGKKKKKKKEI